jgi:transcriptional regulator GlxA family with amidase domain
VNPLQPPNDRMIRQMATHVDAAWNHNDIGRWNFVKSCFGCDRKLAGVIHDWSASRCHPDWFVARLFSEYLIGPNDVEGGESFIEGESNLHTSKCAAWMAWRKGHIIDDSRHTVENQPMPGKLAHRVVIVAHRGGQSLDVFGPADVFDAATRLGAVLPYRVEAVSVEGGPMRLSNGIAIETAAIVALRGKIDTLIVAGGSAPALGEQLLVTGVQRLAKRSIRIASVCTGASVLAEAGLLDGRRATTHWAYSEAMQRRFPAVRVEANQIWVNDDHVWTSAGVTAGMDLALALVSADCGTAIARDIARWLVMYLQRPGGQSQFSDRLPMASPKPSELTSLVDWVEANLGRDLSVTALAAQAAMSTRQLLRRFNDDLSTTPAAFVLHRRLDAARSLVETTSLDLAAIGRQCGFTNVETLHRSFKRRFGTTPGRHRELFAASGDPGGVLSGVAGSN